MTIERPMFPPVDQTRRHFLTVAAGASVACSADQALTLIAAKRTADEADPAFALIRAKRLADVKHCWAIEAQAATESQFGRASDAAWLAAERCEAACDAAHEADWNLATTQPVFFEV